MADEILDHADTMALFSEVPLWSLVKSIGVSVSNQSMLSTDL
jgi:hypothetical protein